MITAVPPTESDLGAELELRVSGLWRALTREAPSDLSHTAASVLASLAVDGPQRVTTLAAREHVAQPSMTILLQRLERRGLLLRQPDPADKRACRLAITAAGEQVLRDRARARSQWLNARMKSLQPDQRALIVRALEHLDVILAEGVGG